MGFILRQLALIKKLFISHILNNRAKFSPKEEANANFLLGYKLSITLLNFL